MSNDKQLTVIEQRDVEFYGDDLTAIRANDGRVYVSVRHLCGALGIDSNGQTQRIRRHTILSEGERACKLHTLQGLQTAVMLRVDLVPLWLSGIRTKSVRDDVRPKLERFQREAANVLWEAFQTGELTADAGFDDLLKRADQDAVEAYQMLQSMIKLARSHVVLSARVDSHEQRLSLVEAKLGDKNQHVTIDQASRIQSAVSTVAFELGKRSGRNEFSGVWKEVYRRMDVPDYRSIPTIRFDETMDFLRQWWESITDQSNVPF